MAKELMTFVVTVERPPGASVSGVREFVRDSLQWAGGCRDPDDPMFHSLNVKSVIKVDNS